MTKRISFSHSGLGLDSAFGFLVSGFQRVPWLYYILLLLLCAASLALVVVTLPGLWLMTAGAAVYAVLTHEKHIGFKSLVSLFLMALVAEILEFSASGAAAKKAGGGKRAAVGALVGGVVGGIVGSFIFPIILSIVGICIGSFAGAAIGELSGGKDSAQAIRVGWGAAKGRLVGVGLKLAFGVAMFGVVLVAGLP